MATERTRKREPGHISKVVKCGVVGDGTVGKTTLLLAYTMQTYIDDYVPTVFDNFSAIEEIDGRLINIILWDTAGQEDYAQFREAIYTKCNYDIFLLCFSVIHPNSYINAKHKWLPELQKNSPGTPYVLLGTKIDMRSEDPKLQHVSTKEGIKRAKELKALMYLECTAKQPDTVNQAFYQIISNLIQKDKDRKVKVEKLYQKELKEEQKLEKKLEKQRKKDEKKAAAGGAPGSSSSSSSIVASGSSTASSSTSNTNASPPATNP